MHPRRSPTYSYQTTECSVSFTHRAFEPQTARVYSACFEMFISTPIQPKVTSKEEPP
jgi:hypothetical protein